MNAIVLPEDANWAFRTEFKEMIEGASNNAEAPVVFDCSNVVHFDAPVAQCLVALQKSGTACTLENVPAPMQEALNLLDLATAFDLPGGDI